jgi:hypothetical protein
MLESNPCALHKGAEPAGCITMSIRAATGRDERTVEDEVLRGLMTADGLGGLRSGAREDGFVGHAWHSDDDMQDEAIRGHRSRFDDDATEMAAEV